VGTAEKEEEEEEEEERVGVTAALEDEVNDGVDIALDWTAAAAGARFLMRFLGAASSWATTNRRKKK